MNNICKHVAIILLNFLHEHTCNSILSNHDIIEIQTFEQTLMENYSLKKISCSKKAKVTYVKHVFLDKGTSY